LPRCDEFETARQCFDFVGVTSTPFQGTRICKARIIADPTQEGSPLDELLGRHVAPAGRVWPRADI
jgi:hypothetical protein